VLSALKSLALPAPVSAARPKRLRFRGIQPAIAERLLVRTRARSTGSEIVCVACHLFPLRAAARPGGPRKNIAAGPGITPRA